MDADGSNHVAPGVLKPLGDSAYTGFSNQDSVDLRMVFAPRFSNTNTITAALTEIERARGFLEAATLADNWVDAMRSRVFLLEAHHTTHIEGTRLTLEDAAGLLAERTVPGADPDDARELLNYGDAFAFVSAYFNDGGPITERLILEIHRRLVAGVRGGSAAPGEYRRVQNYVINAATGGDMS